MRAATPLERAAQKLGAAADDQGRAAAIQRRDVLGDRSDRMDIAPMPRIAPEPRRMNMAGGGQRVEFDPVRIDLHHHESGRTRIAARSGKGVEITLRSAPMPVQVA